ncbi:DUF2273 domain-containing protein [Gordonibacter sp.]|uniref:DUF2273 domain-containing protein n=1 Tax=Gordonibacter sp. TaxID=1968902 RepID=UPI002FC9DB5A
MIQPTMRARPTACPAPAPPPNPQPIPPAQDPAVPLGTATNTPNGTSSERSVSTAFKRTASAYLAHHEHAVLYGIVGFVAALLILIIGFWPTLLLAVFAAAGIAIGAYRDGNLKIRSTLRHLIDLIN